MSILFLTWDGPAQSYLESLFLPILAGLSSQGIAAHVLQVTWASDEQRARAAEAARLHGVTYEGLHIPERLRLAGLPAWIALGARRVKALSRAHGVTCLVPRSLIPASMAMCCLSRADSTALLWDSDGLMADERVDFAGESPASVANRALRAVEACILLRADGVVTRTEAAKQILVDRAGSGFDGSKVVVIPNAKDPELFREASHEQVREIRRAAGVAPDAPWLVYAGSLGPQYYLAEMLALHARVRRARPDARLHLLVWQPEKLAEFSLELRVGVTALSVPPNEVGRYLAAADAGLALRSGAFSQQAVCPIKVIEYLISGTPVIASPVGDLSRQLRGGDVGFLIPDFSEAGIERACDWFLRRVLIDRDGFRARCRSLALAEFSLQRSIERYTEAIHRATSANRAKRCAPN